MLTELVISLAVALAILAVGALVIAVRSRRLDARGGEQAEAWALCRSIADEVGGLVVTPDDAGWPRLTGIVEGVTIEIDAHNYVAGSREPMLGMRCRIGGAEHAPNAAVWIGEIPALHTEFGRPRPLGDPDRLFEVYTRAEPTASDWWNEPGLQETLLSLPGAGVLLVDGSLTVFFSELHALCVRSAMEIPPLVQRGVCRVTIH